MAECKLTATKSQLTESHEPYLDFLMLRVLVTPPGNGNVDAIFATDGDSMAMRVPVDYGIGDELLGYEPGMLPGTWTCTEVEIDGEKIELESPCSFEVINTC